MSQSIQDVQNEIIEEFSMLDGDMEMTIGYVMELGETLEPLEEEKKTEENIVKGCQSKVWLDAQLQGDKIHFKADSNTAITKGLVSILVRILSGRSPKEIVDADLFFIDKVGLNRFIGTQRSNGLGAMIKQMKIYGLAFATQVKSQ
ncbi:MULTISPECIES: SufE family protein [Roseivirga]|uniref:Fe-S metabolism protein SufE n=1 Tax=Roseivirga thermotolerans TaxID=1758176 RepID=A0ABQ3IAL3_9BACT|nr:MULTISPECIES: SufE family protein [Roseivirga]MEC7754919.1 SufE family protein [Bacteroidota bacterium]GHE70128.1 Fe-S metabolism protein SufE [Roseivirga thermotolerans]|tara:strand:+ start:3575 stop:4012 length:438 start_codon:yes stop_codon:yes gene_type:complete